MHSRDKCEHSDSAGWAQNSVGNSVLVKSGALSTRPPACPPGKTRGTSGALANSAVHRLFSGQQHDRKTHFPVSLLPLSPILHSTGVLPSYLVWKCPPFYGEMMTGLVHLAAVPLHAGKRITSEHVLSCSSVSTWVKYFLLKSSFKGLQGTAG